MSGLGRDGLSPVARFSLALGAVLAVMAIVLSVGTAYLVSRYVTDETATFTQQAVASHFGTVFRGDPFKSDMTADEKKTLLRDVPFHFSIYNVVATQFYDETGRIAFSYDESEIGRTIPPQYVPPLASALSGARTSERTTIIADPRLAVPGSSIAFGSFDTHRMDGMNMGAGVSLPPGMARISVLESWVPVKTNGQVVGAVVTWRDMTPIDAALMRIQLTIAGIIALATAALWLILRGVYERSSKRIVAQARALESSLEEVERTYDTTLQALASALDVRDTETGGHSDRVLQYMDLLIVELGSDEGSIALLRRGALLHDIGKIGVPDNVLRKPAPLSDAEWVVMRKHPEYGARIVAGIPFLKDVTEIVRHHHERWDGRGYPDGLAGERIPLGARIFAVADSFDAMTSDRPYRRALSIEAAREEIERCRGSQFDPVVVDAFMCVSEERLAAIAAAAPHMHPVAVAG